MKVHISYYALYLVLYGVTLFWTNFKEAPKYLITDFGAKKGDKEKNYQAIVSAIDEAMKEGGTVVIPLSEWLTKKVHLKSNVILHISEGATLLFSEGPKI